MTLTSDDIRRSARIAGSVTRYHTWPTLTRQSVADHSFHVLRIWYQLWGAPPPEVTEHAIWHDMGEMATGDLPYPVKLRWPQLKEVTSAIEEDHLAKLGVELGDKLSPLQKRRFKICDLLEMIEYGLIEVQMGNRMTEPFIVDLSRNVTHLLKELPEIDRYDVQEFMADNWNFPIEVPEEAYRDEDSVRT